MNQAKKNIKTGKSNLVQKGKQKKSEFFIFLKEKQQKRELLLFVVVYVALFILIRFAYPYPDTFPDTGNYVLCAENMEIGGYRPIGYSWFLNFFHKISSSVHFVFVAQFLFNVIATLFLLFTIKFFFHPAKNYIYLIAAFLVILCPTALYLTNYLMSDSVFTSLTLIWTATAIWLMHRKNAWIFIQKNIRP